MFPLQLPALSKLIHSQKRHAFSGRLLCIDPGETTGIAVYDYTIVGAQLIFAGQQSTWPLKNAVFAFRDLMDTYRPNFVVYEAYHVYKWKLEEHTFSRVPTIQIIGCLRTHCILRDIPNDEQTAQIGKGFATDAKLKLWDLYLPGLVHARDAIRHGAHWLLFHKDAKTI